MQCAAKLYGSAKLRHNRQGKQAYKQYAAESGNCPGFRRIEEILPARAVRHALTQDHPQLKGGVCGKYFARYWTGIKP
jgi:hypothetical protein